MSRDIMWSKYTIYFLNILKILKVDSKSCHYLTIKVLHKSKYFASLFLSHSFKRFPLGELLTWCQQMTSSSRTWLKKTFNILLWSPFQILMAISLLWQELHLVVWAGVAVLVFLIPINALVANRVKKLQIREWYLTL